MTSPLTNSEFATFVQNDVTRAILANCAAIDGLGIVINARTTYADLVDVLRTRLNANETVVRHYIDASMATEIAACRGVMRQTVETFDDFSVSGDADQQCQPTVVPKFSYPAPSSAVIKSPFLEPLPVAQLSEKMSRLRHEVVRDSSLADVSSSSPKPLAGIVDVADSFDDLETDCGPTMQDVILEFQAVLGVAIRSEQAKRLLSAAAAALNKLPAGCQYVPLDRADVMHLPSVINILTQKPQLIQALLSNSVVSIDVTVSKVSIDAFFAYPVSRVDDKTLKTVSPKGSIFADFSQAPCIFFRTIHRRTDVPPGFQKLWVECALVLQQASLRPGITLIRYDRGVRTTLVWRLHPQLVPHFVLGVTVPQTVATETAKKLLEMGAHQLIGHINGSTKAYSLRGFMDTCLKSTNNVDVPVQDDRENWRSLRSGTIFDSEWYRHEYLSLQLGDQFVPYRNTAIKFIDAYLNLIPTLEKLEGRITVVYGGVTVKGRNSQYLAMLHFFTTLWGAPTISDPAGRWTPIAFDNNSAPNYMVHRADASVLTDMEALGRVVANDHVIVCLDLADASVAPEINLKVATWIENCFKSFRNLRFVTSKYCVGADLTVKLCKTLAPLNSVLFSEEIDNRSVRVCNVGRGHGLEGIVFAAPGAEARGLRAYSASGVSCDAVQRIIRDRMYNVSKAQFEPQMSFKVPEEYVRYFPVNYGSISSLKSSTADSVKFAADFNYDLDA